MRVRFALLVVAFAGCATVQPTSTGTSTAKRSTSEYCNPCKQPCLSTDPCGAVPAPAPVPPPPPPPPPPAEPPPAPVPEPAPVVVDPCAPGQTHTPDQCPALDDDGDGVPNGQDRCPLVPGVPENQGCPPERAQINVETGKIDIKEKVFFDSGKATIQGRSYKLLDDVAALLVANPNVGPIVVEGHTDNVGGAALNRKLSQGRAEAVKTYLVTKGVDAGRLQTKGFGPDQPAQPNTTPAGREANRRVEFVIVK